MMSHHSLDRAKERLGFNRKYAASIIERGIQRGQTSCSFRPGSARRCASITETSASGTVPGTKKCAMSRSVETTQIQGGHTMKDSRNKKPLSGAAAYTHALKEHGPEKSMLSGIQRIADEAYNGGYRDGHRDGYQHGVINTLASLFSNKQSKGR